MLVEPQKEREVGFVRVALMGILLVSLTSVFLAFPARDASAQTSPKADYRFQNTRTSSVGTAPALTDIGPGTSVFATAAVDGTSRRVLRFPRANGVALSPTTGVVPNGSYTIVALFELDSVDGFRRIMDFKNGTSDNGLYVQSGSLRFFPSASGTGSPIAANQYVQVVLTRNASTREVVGYVNGVQQFSFSDTSNDALIDTKSDTLRFFRDNQSGGTTGEHSAGSVARIRLYNRVLTAGEVGALDRTDIIVNSTLDGADSNTADGRCSTSTAQQCTLRAAIQQADATPGPNTINFGIPKADANCNQASGVCTIKPTNHLPSIGDEFAGNEVTIDGYTQPGARKNTLANGTNARLKVQLNGAAALSNADGINIGGTGNTVRGLVINGWPFDGVVFGGSGANGNKVEGNFIGTDASGTQDVGNGDDGVSLAGNMTDNTIGGTTPASRNVISGNEGEGIWVADIFGEGASNTKIQGNIIGAKATGTGNLGNSGSGVNICCGAFNITVGGGAAARNVIAFNHVSGISVTGSGLSEMGNPLPGNPLLTNSIFGNNDPVLGGAVLGIDLGANGVTPNDDKDLDTGPNGLQNYPVLSSARTSGSSTTIRGRINSTPDRNIVIQFFSTPTADATGFGEGSQYVGQIRVHTDASGNASFTFQPSAAVPVGQAVTATATGPGNSTSEFSRARGVVPG